MSTVPGTPASPSTRRRRLLVAAAVAALLAVLVPVGVVLGGDDEATSAPPAVTADAQHLTGRVRGGVVPATGTAQPVEDGSRVGGRGGGGEDARPGRV